MCGRFRVEQNPLVNMLLRSVGVINDPIRYSPDCAPTSDISIIRGSEAQVVTAKWWFLLDPVTLKPSKSVSFNSRSDRLNDCFSSWFQPYRTSRCIIPASALVETTDDSKTRHMIELVDSAIAFGGLCKEWRNEETGESVWSASLITLGPIPQWKNIHPKSFPLMLDYHDEDLIRLWLDPDFDNVDRFNDVLKPRMRESQRVTRIGQASKWNPIAESYIIEAAA
jgi:putative SOS response-associated peptidase YedK